MLKIKTIIVTPKAKAKTVLNSTSKYIGWRLVDNNKTQQVLTRPFNP
jgi:hypothetical protein